MRTIFVAQYECAEQEALGHADSSSYTGSAGPVIVTHAGDETPPNTKPYLILDLRTAEEFNRCHLLHGRNHKAFLCEIM
jgi:hypothetical protein